MARSSMSRVDRNDMEGSARALFVAPVQAESSAHKFGKLIIVHQWNTSSTSARENVEIVPQRQPNKN